MTIINVISALGNNNSVYPLLVRDCGIENVAKCVLTYKQNAKESKKVAIEATRERIIDEYGTSAVWLGGVPLIGKIMDKIIKKTGFCPDVNLKLFKESSSQGMDFNISKFKDLAPDAIKDLEKVKANKNFYQNIQGVKFLATTAIPIALMGFLLPKLNFLYTKKKNEKQQENKKQDTTIMNADMKSFMQNRNKVNFTGALASLSNMSNLQKMMILDGGLTVGRVRTGRNIEEKAELAFKMAMMCYLNYVAPKQIEKGLNKLTKSIFGINTALDVKLLNDKNFIQEIKNGSLRLPEGTSEKEIIDFIDNNINSTFVKQAQNLNIISVLKEGVRDPRKFVEIAEVKALKQEIEQFAKDALKSGNIEQFAKRALKAKTFNTLVNVGLSSFLLAGMLPKIQFMFRKILTGSNLDPGVKQYA